MSLNTCVHSVDAYVSRGGFFEGRGIISTVLEAKCHPRPMTSKTKMTQYRGENVKVFLLDDSRSSVDGVAGPARSEAARLATTADACVFCRGKVGHLDLTGGAFETRGYRPASLSLALSLSLWLEGAPVP